MSGARGDACVFRAAELIEDRCKRVRAGPGVVVVRDASGGCVQVAASADARSWLRQRLVENESAQPAIDAGGRPRMDLRELTDSIELEPTATTLEADLLWIDVATRETPEAAASVRASVRVWAVDLDRSQGVRLGAIEWAKASDAGIGPFGGKAPAERWARAAGQVAGVSEAPSLIEGEDERSAHERAIERALGFRGEDLAESVAACEKEMVEAAASHAFERAARLRERVELLAEVLGARGASFVDPIGSVRWIVLGPGDTRQSVGVLLITSGGWANLGSHPRATSGSAIAELARGRGSSGERDTLVAQAIVAHAGRSKHHRWIRLEELPEVGEIGREQEGMKTR